MLSLAQSALAFPSDEIALTSLLRIYIFKATTSAIFTLPSVLTSPYFVPSGITSVVTSVVLSGTSSVVTAVVVDEVVTGIGSVVTGGSIGSMGSSMLWKSIPISLYSLDPSFQGNRLYSRFRPHFSIPYENQTSLRRIPRKRSHTAQPQD